MSESGMPENSIPGNSIPSNSISGSKKGKDGNDSERSGDAA